MSVIMPIKRLRGVSVMFKSYENYLHGELPLRPSGKYAHLIVLRRTDSYAVFQTDGELNTALVRSGVANDSLMTRITIFKRKQTTPERLAGRELLRAYGIIGDNCLYNEGFCGECPDCILYGFAIGESGSEKSKVYADTAYSITGYDESHETFTLNAPYEDGTMTKGGATTNRFSEQDHVKPQVFFPTVVTLRDPTARGLAYLINNIRRTKRYGAQTTRTGSVENQILGLVFADGEIFSNLRLTQAVYDYLLEKDRLPAVLAEERVVAAVNASVSDLVERDGIVYELIQREELAAVLQQLDGVFGNAQALGNFMQELFDETRRYVERAGAGSKKTRAKAKEKNESKVDKGDK